LEFLQTQPHAAVSATVDCAPPRARGLVNAVLRRVASAGRLGAQDWPDLATRLSYPDWIVTQLEADLGVASALAALETMNEPPTVSRRADGYVQDLASQWVAAAVGAGAGEQVADLCAAPGGKATAMAQGGPAVVVALDRSAPRAGLVAANAAGLGLGNVAVVVGDGSRPPLRSATFDRVLVDAPCSGLGVLRRRADARWRVQPDDVITLAAQQRALVDAALLLARPGGVVVYSVCTLTHAETVGLDDWMHETHPDWRTLQRPTGPWDPVGRGARLLPQTAGTDGMFLVAYQRGAS
jgi:16S rRNA (cytosine967-C5)-methyltransferase